MYGVYLAALERGKGWRLSTSRSRGNTSEDRLNVDDMGLWSRFEFPREETDEQDPERDRQAEIRELISLSSPRDAMSSMKEGRPGIG